MAATIAAVDFANHILDQFVVYRLRSDKTVDVFGRVVQRNLMVAKMFRPPTRSVA